MGPIAQYCPWKALAAPLGSTSTSPFITWGLPSPCSVLSLLSPPYPSAIFREKETKGSKSGGGEGLDLSPLLSPRPLFPSLEGRCSYQKRLLRDDLFYFSLTFSSLGKEKKKKDKSDHKRPKKKKNPKPPPNPQKVMSFPYPWNSFFVLFCFVLGNNIFLKVALLWSGNLK